MVPRIKFSHKKESIDSVFEIYEISPYYFKIIKIVIPNVKHPKCILPYFRCFVYFRIVLKGFTQNLYIIFSNVQAFKTSTNTSNIEKQFSLPPKHVAAKSPAFC